MGDNLGHWAKIVVQIVVVISLFGTNVSQVVASSSDAYYLAEKNSLDKRWAMLFAANQWYLVLR